MPKEAIPTSVGPFHAKVGWSHGTGVQVGVETEESEHSIFWTLLRSEMKGLDDGLSSLATETGVEFPRAVALLTLLDTLTGRFRGVWSDLDRQGCNHLIRTLRRARDAAYGRD